MKDLARPAVATVACLAALPAVALSIARLIGGSNQKLALLQAFGPDLTATTTATVRITGTDHRALVATLAPRRAA